MSLVYKITHQIWRVNCVNNQTFEIEIIKIFFSINFQEDSVPPSHLNKQKSQAHLSITILNGYQYLEVGLSPFTIFRDTEFL